MQSGFKPDVISVKHMCAYCSFISSTYASQLVSQVDSFKPVCIQELHT